MVAASRRALDAVGLDTSYLSRSPLRLSGGEKRRVALASVLAVSYTHLDVYKRQTHRRKGS